MTLISAIVSSKGTAIATDSVLTLKQQSNPQSVLQIEWQLPKLIRLEKFKGSISFWGDAVAEPRLPLPDNKTKIKFNWTLFKWLTDKAKNITESNLEDFVKRLTIDLKSEYKKKNWLSYGIGLHITGYELIGDTYVPELFLISSFANPSYNEVKDWSYSRETYHTLMNTPTEPGHRERHCRLAVHQYLIDGGLFIYNNGDPNLFNHIFDGIFAAYLHSRKLGRAKDLEDLRDLSNLVRRPIEIVAKFQSDFFRKDKILIGGKIHDLAVWRDGNYFSISGD